MPAKGDKSKANSELSSPASLTANDIIILVIGLTGAGKSTFIQYASEQDDVEIGHSLAPCTGDIHLIKANRPINNRRVVFVDTPGFGDKSSQDAKTLRKITTFLHRISRQKLEITAILYVHRISDNRMTYTSLSNINIFTPFCSKKGGSGFTVATTMWADANITEKIGSEREEDLKTFVPPMPEKVNLCRFTDTFESAWKITNDIAENFSHSALDGLTEPMEVEQTPTSSNKNPDRLASVSDTQKSKLSQSTSYKTSEWGITSSGETVIAVIGLTGSGKSTFIAKACNADEERINHSMRRRDPNIRAIKARNPNDNRNIVFVDTPGFDNVDASDTLALIQIAEWLNKASNANGPFSAIIYLHRITDSRISGPSRENLDIFASLCGQKTMPDVLLVTTMWGNIDEQTGRIREDSLKREFWGETRAESGKAQRFENTYDSAWTIVGTISPSETPLEPQVARHDDISTAKVFGLPIPKWLNDLASALRTLALASRANR